MQVSFVVLDLLGYWELKHDMSRNGHYFWCVCHLLLTKSTILVGWLVWLTGRYPGSSRQDPDLLSQVIAILLHRCQLGQPTQSLHRLSFMECLIALYSRCVCQFEVLAASTHDNCLEQTSRKCGSVNGPFNKLCHLIKNTWNPSYVGQPELVITYFWQFIKAGQSSLYLVHVYFVGIWKKKPVLNKK